MRRYMNTVNSKQSIFIMSIDIILWVFVSINGAADFATKKPEWISVLGIPFRLICICLCLTRKNGEME